MPIILKPQNLPSPTVSYLVSIYNVQATPLKRDPNLHPSSKVCPPLCPADRRIANTTAKGKGDHLRGYYDISGAEPFKVETRLPRHPWIDTRSGETFLNGDFSNSRIFFRHIQSLPSLGVTILQNRPAIARRSSLVK
ncbi:hypothetical protein I308_104287 [Cryptococcus tetragattii IND107]|uniref:Uncharacterized protein n=1 Tax=Cryptococcus tetragattii IND107 TaxID=1296105 RepID=A0ABR3BQW5_9TREE